jgi:hypothetical protein
MRIPFFCYHYRPDVTFFKRTFSSEFNELAHILYSYYLPFYFYFCIVNIIYSSINPLWHSRRHFFLTRQSCSVLLTSCCTCCIDVCSGRPLFVFPCDLHSNILTGHLCSFIRRMCPYHIGLFPFSLMLPQSDPFVF